MLGYVSENKLKALLVAVGDGERDIEAARQRLCSIRDFALNAAFERVDRDCSARISSIELNNFLRDNGVLTVSDSECQALISYFDNDSDGRVAFSEFI
jgi:Ca2+-binding EF-hand superfamily protein